MQSVTSSIKSRHLSSNVSNNFSMIDYNRADPPKSSQTHNHPRVNNNVNFQLLEKMTKDENKNIIKTEINAPHINHHDDEKPKNMNIYRHILSYYRTTKSDVDWIFDLRHGPHTDYILQDIRHHFFHEPIFYKQDFEKFIEKKNRNKKIIDPIPKNENVQDVSHLIKERLGEAANATKIRFELNLRNYSEYSNNKFAKANSHDIFVEDMNKVEKSK